MYITNEIEISHMHKQTVQLSLSKTI